MGRERRGNDHPGGSACRATYPIRGRGIACGATMHPSHVGGAVLCAPMFEHADDRGGRPYGMGTQGEWTAARLWGAVRHTAIYNAAKVW